MQMYSEELLIPYFALKLGRPVRWIEDRRENLLTSYQSREQVHNVEVGFDLEVEFSGSAIAGSPTRVPTRRMG